MRKLSKYKNSEIGSANHDYPLLIIGAGLNGLAAAHELKKTGAEPVILDSSSQPVSTWRSRHDQLRLNTHRFISHLPGMRIPRNFGAFPSRDDMVGYLEDYEKFLDVPIHRIGPAILPTTVLGIPLQLLSPLMGPLPAWSVDLLMAATEWFIFGNLKKYNLPKHPDGVATRLIKEGVAPAFDDGFVSALREGKVTALPKIERFEGGTVHLAGGQTVNPDAVICATGYSPRLESLVGHLGVLDEAGKPIYSGPESHPGLNGLWFMGMTPRLPGVFYTARREARQIAVMIKKKRLLRKHHAPIHHQLYPCSDHQTG